MAAHDIADVHRLTEVRVDIKSSETASADAGAASNSALGSNIIINDQRDGSVKDGVGLTESEAAPDFNDKGTGRYDPGPNDDDDHHDAHRQDNRRYSIVETTSRTNTYAGSVAGTLCDWASLARNSPITMVPPTDGLNEAEVARKGDECGTKDTHSEHDSWPDVDKKSILGMGYGGDEDRSSPLPQIVGLPRVEDLPLGEGWDDAGNDISKIRNEAVRRAACEAHIASLKREAQDIRAGKHPEYLRQKALALEAGRRRRLVIESRAKREREIMDVVMETRGDLDKEMNHATALKISKQRLTTFKKKFSAFTKAMGLKAGRRRYATSAAAEVSASTRVTRGSGQKPSHERLFGLDDTARPRKRPRMEEKVPQILTGYLLNPMLLKLDDADIVTDMARITDGDKVITENAITSPDQLHDKRPIAKPKETETAISREGTTAEAGPAVRKQPSVLLQTRAVRPGNSGCNKAPRSGSGEEFSDGGGETSGESPWSSAGCVASAGSTSPRHKRRRASTDSSTSDGDATFSVTDECHERSCKRSKGGRSQAGDSGRDNGKGERTRNTDKERETADADFGTDPGEAASSCGGDNLAAAAVAATRAGKGRRAKGLRRSSREKRLGVPNGGRGTGGSSAPVRGESGSDASHCGQGKGPAKTKQPENGSRCGGGSKRARTADA